jgi:hypothetical protein
MTCSKRFGRRRRGTSRSPRCCHFGSSRSYVRQSSSLTSSPAASSKCWSVSPRGSRTSKSRGAADFGQDRQVPRQHHIEQVRTREPNAGCITRHAGWARAHRWTTPHRAAAPARELHHLSGGAWSSLAATRREAGTMAPSVSGRGALHKQEQRALGRRGRVGPPAYSHDAFGVSPTSGASKSS